MNPEWLILAELAPHPDGYDTPEATALMKRIQGAAQQAGAPDDHSRVRLVVGDGHTMMRFETCSPRVLEQFRRSGGSSSER